MALPTKELNEDLIGKLWAEAERDRAQQQQRSFRYDDMLDASRFAFDMISGANPVSRGDVILKPGEYEIIQEPVQIEDKSK